MATQGEENSYKDSDIEQMSEAIAAAVHWSSFAAQTATEVYQSTTRAIAGSTNFLGETVGSTAQRFVERGTETVGKIVTPIAENPLVKYATKLPGIGWIMAGLGQVDIERVQSDVGKLRQNYPLENSEQLAHRIIFDAALKAAGIGLITNFAPPLALTLFAVDMAAITALQAEMIYRIAAVYGFSLQDPTRRGEVLMIFGLSAGGSNVLKMGLSLVELLPVVGAVVGASGDATLLYSLGAAACQFYEAKKKSAPLDN